MIGLLGSTYFIGFAIGSIIFPRLADIIGRKPVELLGTLIYAILMLCFIFGSNMSGLFVTLGIFGLRSSMNLQISYIHILEFLPAIRRNCFTTSIFLIDVISAIAGPLYYNYASSFHGLFYFSLFLAIFNFFVTLFWIPESYRFYISKRKFS